MKNPSSILDLFIHIDEYLAIVIQNTGAWSYIILFLVIFMETGFVVTPFLPGDSLLFAAGALAATGSLTFCYYICFYAVQRFWETRSITGPGIL